MSPAFWAIRCRVNIVRFDTICVSNSVAIRWLCQKRGTPRTDRRMAGWPAGRTDGHTAALYSGLWLLCQINNQSFSIYKLNKHFGWTTVIVSGECVPVIIQTKDRCLTDVAGQITTKKLIN